MLFGKTYVIHGFNCDSIRPKTQFDVSLDLYAVFILFFSLPSFSTKYLRIKKRLAAWAGAFFSVQSHF